MTSTLKIFHQDTFNYFFHFNGGNVSARNLATTPDDEAWSFQLCPTPQVTKKAISKQLFGTPHLRDAKLENVQLERHPGIPLKAKTAASLAKKYFSIPEEDLWYFPSIETLNQVAAEEVDEDDLTAAEIAHKKDAEIRGKGAICMASQKQQKA